MIRVGVIGEDPNDTDSIINLLKKKYDEGVVFKPIAKRINGHQLDSKKLETIIEIETGSGEYALIIYMRDLDGLKSEKSKINIKQTWFNKLNSKFGGNGIFLLNIYEIEALILADIESFNRIFKTNIPFAKNPMMQSEPKEFLMDKTRKSQKRYSESSAPEIFAKLDVDKVIKNCKYFKEFIDEFDMTIKKAS